MKYKIQILFVILALSFAGIAQGRNQTQSIQIKGSDTMVNLAQAWAEVFMQENSDIFIAVTGGGSGTGVAGLINKSCDIAFSSREMSQKEIDLARAHNVEPVEFTVAFDGLSVVVHPSNPISQLTIDELSGIFTGKIKNWKELGWRDMPIVILSREVNSGTHVFFKEAVLRKGDKNSNEEFAKNALLLPSSQAIADEVSENPNAIGYFGMGYISPKQKTIAVAKDTKSPYINPIAKNVINGSYTITRPLLIYTNGNPQGRIKKFIDFILSKKGQEIVAEIDFVPVK